MCEGFSVTCECRCRFLTRIKEHKSKRKRLLRRLGERGVGGVTQQPYFERSAYPILNFLVLGSFNDDFISFTLILKRFFFYSFGKIQKNKMLDQDGHNLEILTHDAELLNSCECTC